MIKKRLRVRERKWDRERERVRVREKVRERERGREWTDFSEKNVNLKRVTCSFSQSAFVGQRETLKLGIGSKTFVTNFTSGKILNNWKKRKRIISSGGQSGWAFVSSTESRQFEPPIEPGLFPSFYLLRCLIAAHTVLKIGKARQLWWHRCRVHAPEVVGLIAQRSVRICSFDLAVRSMAIDHTHF